jgi:hydrogenase expression/formation protein HypC
MCLGIPMIVVEVEATSALCRSRSGEERRCSTLLVGDIEPGTHVLIHIDSIVRVLDAEEAGRIADALEGLAAALDGRDFDHLFADLIDREPQLPEHLR